jgi:biotin synthase
MFDILGLIPKQAFADGEQPQTEPDEKILERRRKEAERQEELEAARRDIQDSEFRPRKIIVT